MEIIETRVTHYSYPKPRRRSLRQPLKAIATTTPEGDRYDNPLRRCLRQRLKANAQNFHLFVCFC
ncbi:MAG: hypothetical protein V7L00_07035 [Nostoc sp.]|uniref:hypothetical protein n=1 Tax=Nostoc sp. TaxID=1180 RepID=UPI002FFC4CA4